MFDRKLFNLLTAFSKRCAFYLNFVAAAVLAKVCLKPSTSGLIVERDGASREVLKGLCGRYKAITRLMIAGNGVFSKCTFILATFLGSPRGFIFSVSYLVILYIMVES
jgi:hypothetical protein